METFPNRFDEKYQEYLCEVLSTDRLLETSFPVSRPRERMGEEYGKCCRIDYIGLSGTILLDAACNYISRDWVPMQFEALFQNAEVLNQQGIFVKMRFLYMYPYTTSFFSLIQAESSVHRAAVDSPSFLRDFRTVEEVDEQTFFGSTTFTNLRNSLEHLQELIEEYRWNEASPNTVRVRFSLADVRVSALTINDALFYYPYLLSKEKRISKRLALRAPVVHVDRKTDEKPFKHFDDHFRYLWDLDTTMTCEDATPYNICGGGSLSKFKPPRMVTYQAKADRIRELMMEQSGSVSPENEIESWKFKLQHMLDRLTTVTKPTPRIESVFIACSWVTGEDGKSKPNRYAVQLSKWLQEDFGGGTEFPIMSVHVIEAAFGDSLADQVYARLQEATLGIVLFTADIEDSEGRYYTKPNVVYEAGYLVRHLEKPRTLFLREHPVDIPSNISHRVYVDLAHHKLALSYGEIARWLNNACPLINDTRMESCLRRHIGRINDMMISGQLSQPEGAQAKRRIEQDIDGLSI